MAQHLKACAPLLQSLYLDGNPFGAKGAEALRELVWASDELVVLGTSETPAEKMAAAAAQATSAEDAASLSAENAAALSALTSIKTKLDANKERLGPEKALVMTLSQKRVKASTGNPFKKAVSDDEAAQNIELLLDQEAFSDMPVRQKYQRGQYLKGLKKQVS